METLSFFDCNCSFGRRKIVDPGSLYTREDLLRYMDQYGISKALVYHSLAREDAPITGNNILMEQIKDYPALVPVWIVIPHHTGEFYEPGILIEKMKENNVRIVRMFSGDNEHKYSLASWNCGELLSALEEHRVPVIMQMNAISFDILYNICNQYPKLKLIISEIGYRVDRDLYPLLNKVPNLYIETMGYKVHNGIEEICERFGAKHLIFGSGMPVKSGASAVCMINYARISENEKRMIAYENLETLLEEVRL